MRIKKLTVGEYETNCYIIFSANNRKAILIDPAFDVKYIESELENAIVEKIILTHGHIDHIYECNYFKDKYKAPLYAHKETDMYLKDRDLNSPMNIFPDAEARIYSVDKFLTDGDEFKFDEYTFRVIHAPGHTMGCICLLCEDSLFTGDVLFYESVGRTDFPLSSQSDLLISLKKLMLLNDNITVYPGHMQNSTIAHERKNNPYIIYYLGGK